MHGEFTERKRQVNEVMWEGLRQQAPERAIPFFCECDHEHCYQAVWLSASEFEEAREDPSWVALVAGHLLERATSTVA